MTHPTVVLITGPNRGIGRALFEAFLARPNTTVIGGVRNPAASAATALHALPAAHGSRGVVVKIDSSQDGDAKAAVETMRVEHGITYLDIVIANAGTGHSAASVLDISPEVVRQHVEVNTIGALSLFQATEALLRESSAPKFFTLSSNLASMGLMEYVPGPWVAYGISKVALNFLTRKIHFENEWLVAAVLSPGWVQTDMGAYAAEMMGVDSAPVKLDDSIKGMLQVIDQSSRPTTSGTFTSHEGSSVAW